MIVGLNDEEWGELFHERAELLKIYCALKRVMDFKTGVAGTTRRLNDSFFTELLYVEARQGVAELKYTRSQLRKMLGRLESIGLIDRIGPNVFKLVLALSNSSVQERQTRSRARTGHEVEPEVEPEKAPSNIVVLGDDNKSRAIPDCEAGTYSKEKWSPPLTSKIYIDRYSKVSQIHDELKTVINELSLINVHSRKIMTEWLQLNLTQVILREAIDRAIQAKHGQPFGVAYLNPIIKQQIYKTENQGESNEANRSGKRSGASVLAEGCSGAFDDDQGGCD